MSSPKNVDLHISDLLRRRAVLYLPSDILTNNHLLAVVAPNTIPILRRRQCWVRRAPLLGLCVLASRFQIGTELRYFCYLGRLPIYSWLCSLRDAAKTS